MQYQSFTGTDLKEALSAVRAAYGPDALIGPTRHVQVADSSGTPQLRVEVQAAPSGGRSAWPFASGLLPQSTSSSSRQLPRKRPAPRSSKTNKSDVSQAIDASAVGRAPSTMSRMEAQIAELRAMVEAMQAQLPSKQRAMSLLQEMAIEGPVARQLGSRMGKAKTDPEILDRIRQRLGRLLPESENILASGKPELIACVGPTGVGKTTTLAKIAAQARLEYGRSVAVISLDHFRVGASDQWQRYGKLMGMPVFSPKSAAELEELLTSNGADLILVDTPSVGSTQDASMRSFADLSHKARRRTHVMLLLPAWLRGNDAEGLVQHYEHLSPTSLSVTKMDETDGVGGVIQASIAAQLPINYLSRGPRVPEHLESANKSQIVELALVRACPTVH